jgi:hypothetical protein
MPHAKSFRHRTSVADAHSLEAEQEDPLQQQQEHSIQSSSRNYSWPQIAANLRPQWFSLVLARLNNFWDSQKVGEQHPQGTGKHTEWKQYMAPCRSTKHI